MNEYRRRLKERSVGAQFQTQTRFWSAVTLGLGSLMGAGLYVLIGLGTADAGPALWLAYGVCALLVAPSALMYADLSRQIPQSGGGYVYAYRQLGSFWGFLVGWLLAVGSVFACALYALGFAWYVVEFLPEPWRTQAVAVGIGLAGLAALAGVALCGVGGDRIQGVLTWGNVAILLLLVVGAATVADVGKWTPHFPNGIGGVGGAISLIYISFFGYQLVANNSEEVLDAPRTVPRAMLTALGIASAIYLLMAVAAVLVVPAATLAKSDAPLVLVATVALGPWGAIVVGVGGILAAAGALNGTLVSQARQLYAMGRDRMLPRRIGVLAEGSGIPRMALLGGAGLTALVLLSADVAFVARVANFALLASMLPLSFALFLCHRELRAAGEQVSLFRMAVPFVAFVANLALLATLDVDTLLTGGALVGAGFGVFIAYTSDSARRGRSGLAVALGQSNLPPILSRGERIIVPLANPETRETLFTIALALLPRDEGQLIPLTVVLADEGEDLRDTLRRFSDDEDALIGFEAVQKLASEQGAVVRPLVQAARDLASGICDAARDESCQLIIMGYSASMDGTPNPLQAEVMSRTRAHVVLYACRASRPALRIAVSLGGEANLPLMVRVAGAIAERSGGSVTYLSVVPEELDHHTLVGARDTQIEALRRHVAAVPFSATLVRSDSPLESLVEQSANFDLMIVGATASRVGQRASVGAFSSIFASRALCSVIVVRVTPALQRLLISSPVGSASSLLRHEGREERGSPARTDPALE
jgi:amino acid transporter